MFGVTGLLWCTCEINFLKKKDFFKTISTRLFLSIHHGLVLRISEDIYLSFKSFEPENISESISISEIVSKFVSIAKNDDLSASDFLSFSIEKVISDPVAIAETLAFQVDAQKNDTVSIFEDLQFSTHYFTAVNEAATINETLVFYIEFGSNIVNGSSINGALI